MSTIQFTVYNTTTGEILRTGHCQDIDLQHQAQTGESAIAGLAAPNQYIVNNTFTNLPTKPGDNYDYDYTNKAWVLNSTTSALSIRATRDQYLTACDWTQGADSPLTTAVKTTWATYRQALRDITKQPTFPASVTWPTPPA